MGSMENLYTPFVSIAKLMVAALSNVSMSHQKLLDNGSGYADTYVELRDGQRTVLNDFIYGIMCDPQYVQAKYDNVMGKGAWREMAVKLDEIFAEWVNEESWNPSMSEVVKSVMTDLGDYLEIKNIHRRKEKSHLEDDIKAITNDFRNILNPMQQEYGAYFTQRDVDSSVARLSMYKKGLVWIRSSQFSIFV